ncbi:MAG TPA: hypothetical protein VMU66_05665 [Gaiellales bacterium]|nr:hypothetical protein [Gaiellales bacterium]
MPAEARRLQQPVGVRDKRLLAALACGSVLAVAAEFTVARTQPSQPVQPGCVAATVAGVMGGGIVKGCGADAAVVCRTYAARYERVAARCRAVRRHSAATTRPRAESSS